MKNNNISEERKLTKKEKYLLKKQQKQEEQLRRVRKKRIKKIISISAPLVLIIGIISFFIINNAVQEKKPKPRLEIPETEYDAGDVFINDDKVKHTYEIKNTGQGDLKISNIKTSCMCTTARLKVGEKQSPEFGMHTNSAFWSEKIAPGQTGFLEVVFDQAFHGPGGTGQALRVVYISTNDPKNPKAEVKLLADVIP